jgi:hypothetical protein
VLPPSDYEGDGTSRDQIIAQPDDPDVNVVTTPLEERERREAMVALAVVGWLQIPAVIYTHEVANETVMQRMADRINAEHDERDLPGKDEQVYVPGIDQRYIDVGYLVDTTRVEVDLDSLIKIDLEAPATVPPGDPDDTGKCSQGPGREFLDDRAPLLAEITYLSTGETFTHVTIHDKSRCGGTEANEEFEPCRVQQTESVLDHLVEHDITERAIIGGDINTFRESPTLELYEERGLESLSDRISEDRRFTYQFDGRVQFLDRRIVTPAVNERVEIVDSPKIINDTPSRRSSRTRPPRSVRQAANRCWRSSDRSSRTHPRPRPTWPSAAGVVA